MSARAPRRTFAASFVITVAAAPGCTTAPPRQETRPRPDPVVERDHRDEVPTPVERDHRTEPDRVEPGPGNPPPPTPPVVVADDSPPAATEQRWVLEMHDGKCTTRVNVTCAKPEPGKPMRTCNPPAPRAYTCLTGMTEGASLQIVQWAGAKDCVIPPPTSHCPKGAMCNPPPPLKVACPQ